MIIANNPVIQPELVHQGLQEKTSLVVEKIASRMYRF